MTDAVCGEQPKAADDPGRHRLESQPSSRTGENPPYGMIGRVEETSASFEARSAPRSYPTPILGLYRIAAIALHHSGELRQSSRQPITQTGQGTKFVRSPQNDDYPNAARSIV